MSDCGSGQQDLRRECLMQPAGSSGVRFATTFGNLALDMQGGGRIDEWEPGVLNVCSQSELPGTAGRGGFGKERSGTQAAPNLGRPFILTARPPHCPSSDSAKRSVSFYNGEHCRCSAMLPSLEEAFCRLSEPSTVHRARVLRREREPWLCGVPAGGHSVLSDSLPSLDAEASSVRSMDGLRGVEPAEH